MVDVSSTVFPSTSHFGFQQAQLPTEIEDKSHIPKFIHMKNCHKHPYSQSVTSKQNHEKVRDMT